MSFFKENFPFIDIQIWVKPGSSKEEIMPPNDKGLIVHVHARPQDGQANEAIRSLIAKWFHLPKSQVHLVRGEKSRQKCFRIPHQPHFLTQLIEINKL